MLKDLFDKGKCALGFHVEAWQYAQSNLCRQTSRCTRCGVVSERTAHVWEGWHRFDDISCSAIRACQRCRRQETQDDHAWEAWAYDQRGSCQQHVVCSRCHQPGTGTRIEHARGDWTWSPFYETGVAVCGRCGEMVFATSDGEEEPVTFQQADAAIQHLLAASSVEELRQRIIQQQAVLFTPVAVHAFRFSADQRASDADDAQVIVHLAGVVARCRDEGIDTVLPPPPPPEPAQPPPSPASPPPRAAASSSASASASASSSTQAEARLVGYWRSTEVMSSSGFSMATDTHLILEPDASFTFWTMSSGSAGSHTSDREHGTWSSGAGTLRLVFANGTTMSRRIVVERGTMLWPDDDRWRLWERIR